MVSPRLIFPRTWRLTTILGRVRALWDQSRRAPGIAQLNRWHRRPERVGQVVAGAHARGCLDADTGKIRLDGAALEQWSPETLGQHIVYLPQDVELFDGTVA